MTKTDNQARSWAMPIAVSLALILGAIFLKDYFIVIIVAAIAAFTFYPLYELTKRLVKNENLASWIVAISSLIVVLIAVGLVSAATIHEVRGATSSIVEYVKTNDPGDIAQAVVAKANDFTASLTSGNVTITHAQIADWATSAATTIGKQAPGILASWAGSAGSMITLTLIYLYLFAAFCTKKDKLIVMLRGLNPLGDKVSNLYLSKAAAMTKAMVRGQLIIAFIQGLIGATLLYIAGLDYFWIALLLLTFLSIIPLGAGIVIIPIGIVLLLLGDIWQGLMLILGHLLIISSVDNIIRPVLVPKSARLHPALTLLSVFAGLGLFGILGVVIGPVIMILIVTTINIYLEQKGIIDNDESAKPTPKARPRLLWFAKAKKS